MAKQTVIITGDKKVNRMLRRLSAKEGKAAVRKAARPALKPLLKEARANAPKGATGQLKKNVKIKALPRSRKHVGARVTSGPGKATNDGEFYGGFLDLGTKKIEANRWLREAADSKRKSVLAIYGKLLRKEIIARARKAAR